MYYIDILESVYRELAFSLYSKDCEKGGIIGVVDGIVMKFAADNFPIEASTKLYKPNIIKLNEIIDDWSRKGIIFVGFVHSHLKGNSLSEQDVIFARNYMNRFSFNRISMGVFDCSTLRLSMYYITNTGIFPMKFNIKPRCNNGR